MNKKSNSTEVEFQEFLGEVYQQVRSKTHPRYHWEFPVGGFFLVQLVYWFPLPRFQPL